MDEKLWDTIKAGKSFMVVDQETFETLHASAQCELDHHAPGLKMKPLEFRAFTIDGIDIYWHRDPSAVLAKLQDSGFSEA